MTTNTLFFVFNEIICIGQYLHNDKHQVPTLFELRLRGNPSETNILKKIAVLWVVCLFVYVINLGTI